MQTWKPAQGFLDFPVWKYSCLQYSTTVLLLQNLTQEVMLWCNSLQIFICAGVAQVLRLVNIFCFVVIVCVRWWDTSILLLPVSWTGSFAGQFGLINWVLWARGAQPWSSWVISPWNKWTGVTGLTGNRDMMAVQATPGSFLPALSCWSSLNFTIVTKIIRLGQMTRIVYAVRV